MAADDTAASVYKGLVANADPLGAYVAGAQLRMKLQTIDLAAQAQQFDTTLNFLKLADDRAAQKQKAELAAKELEIATFNAETNRINATRARSTSAGGGMSGPVPSIYTDEEGNTRLSFGATATGTAETPQQPTTGEGDVTALTAGAPEAPSLLPTGGVMPEPPSGMAFPTMPGQPQRRPSGGLYVTGTSTDMSTGKTRVTTSTKNPNAPEKVVTDEIFKKYQALAEPLGQEAVLGDADADGVKKITFRDKPTLKGGDFSVASLPSEVQKELQTGMSELVSAAQTVKSPTDAQKMAAVGVTDPMQMTDELWSQGYNLALQDPATPSDPAAQARLARLAREHAARLNLTFSGKTGYVPVTEQSVLQSLGVSTQGMQRPAQKASPAGTAGQGTVLANAKPSAPAAQADPEVAQQVMALQQEIAVEKDPKVKAQKQAFLEQLQRQQPAAPAAKPAEQQTGDVFSQIATSKSTKADPRGEKTEVARQKWESSKQAVLQTVVETGGRDDIESLAKADVGNPDVASELGSDTTSKRAEWLKANGPKLAQRMGLKSVDFDTVVFVDADGKGVKLSEVFSAAFNDPRTKAALKQQTVTQHTAPSGAKVTIGKPVKAE